MVGSSSAEAVAGASRSIDLVAECVGYALIAARALTSGRSKRGRLMQRGRSATPFVFRCSGRRKRVSVKDRWSLTESCLPKHHTDYSYKGQAIAGARPAG